MTNHCPKCGRVQHREGKSASISGPFYCPVPGEKQYCEHNRFHGEHLYDRCVCGFALNFRACADNQAQPPMPDSVFLGGKSDGGS